MGRGAPEGGGAGSPVESQPRPRSRLGALWLLLPLALGGPAVSADPKPDTRVHDQLRRLATQRIYFGHQSVGMNLLEGVRATAARYPDVPLRMIEVSGDLPAGTFGHAFLPANGDPELKLKNFERALSSGIGSVADVAFLKFCYADFLVGTNPAELFARYQTTLRELHAKYPRVTFVHVTVPLTTVEVGTLSTFKRFFGRAPGGLRENMLREEFNDLLREAYVGREPLFDLARLESTSPDGEREWVEWNNRKIPVLLASYTEDGGHLNPRAQLRLGAELIAFLASAS
jgi:hypothetical protein